MITVTDSAKNQALRLMEEGGQEGYFIRVGVQGGGCSGLMYDLGFDDPSHLSRLFKKVTGQSPTEYRSLAISA